MAKKQMALKGKPETVWTGNFMLCLTGDSVAITGLPIRAQEGDRGQVELRIGKGELKEVQRFIGQCIAFWGT